MFRLFALITLCLILFNQCIFFSTLVWSSINDPTLHNPPTDYFWKEQHKWGTGPECTTILCRANGQAVAWTTAAHRFTKDAFAEATKTNEDGRNNYQFKLELYSSKLLQDYVKFECSNHAGTALGLPGAPA